VSYAYEHFTPPNTVLCRDKSQYPSHSSHAHKALMYDTRLQSPIPIPSHVPLPRPLEEEPHNKHLQSRHRNHHNTLQDTKIEDPLLCASHSREIPVLSCPKVLLIPIDRAQLAAQLQDALFKHRRLFRGGALFGGQLGAGFVLHLFIRRLVGERESNEEEQTAISKSTTFSAKVLISLLKQNRYSPTSFAVKTKSPCRSFSPFMIVRSAGPTTS